MVHLEHHGLRTARGQVGVVFGRLHAQLGRRTAGPAGLGGVDEGIARLGHVFGDRLLIRVVQRNGDVDAVSGIGEADLTCLAGVGALQVAAVIMRCRPRHTRKTEGGGGRDQHGRADRAQR